MHNYVNLVQATLEVESQNPNAWPILLDTNGNLSEGPGSNIFIVKDGIVITPREQFILSGISRRVAIELAQELGIEVQEADIDLYDAYTADEAFVSVHELLHMSGVVVQRIVRGRWRGPRPR